MDYQQTLKEAQEKLRLLGAQRDAVDREIEALMRIIEGAKIATQDPSFFDPDSQTWVPRKAPDSEPAGVTESIRKILRRSTNALTPTEIRDALEAMGIQGSSPKNLLIHVHKALGRIGDAGELSQTPRDGKMAYRLLTATERQFRDTFGTLFATSPSRAVRATGREGVSTEPPKQPKEKR
jgi:hypothetical protein